MATGMHMDKSNVDCLVLGHHDQDRKVSAKSMTMRAMTLCKNLSGFRELLLIANQNDHIQVPTFLFFRSALICLLDINISFVCQYIYYHTMP